MTYMEIEDDYMRWVYDNVVGPFKERNIEVTDNAFKLIALTMQMQVAEAVVENQEVLLRRAEEVGGSYIVDYYLARFGPRRMTYNRAFHMLDAWGFVVKYPWQRTGEGF